MGIDRRPPRPTHAEVGRCNGRRRARVATWLRGATLGAAALLPLAALVAATPERALGGPALLVALLSAAVPLSILDIPRQGAGGRRRARAAFRSGH